jgi:predicted ATPase/transcriptional regulator with XRE-family HTH domain
MAEYHPRIIDVSSVPHPRTGGPVLPRWSDVLRGLREARGVTQDGWAALLGYGRATVHRWERGEAVPGPDAVEALVATCQEQGLLRSFARGRLEGMTLTAELLRDLLAEARVSAAPESAPPEEPPGARGRGGTGGRAAAPRPTILPLPNPAPRHNLPLSLASFVGRETELEAIRTALADARLVTLVGAGGSGKSRLAVEVGRGLTADYPDGVWLVELAPLADPELLPHVVAGALGLALAATGSPLATLVAALEPRQLLLLLDNCEHLIDASARLAEALLQRCPTVRILATSREGLGITGEVRWRVPPLAVPPDDAARPIVEVTEYAAARLFVERARAALPTFDPGEQAAAIAHVCRRLDGMPLAIELAAALTPVLSAEQIATRLDRRLDLLAGGSRTALPRQQTLRAAIDWSYDLLLEPERRLLRRLAVFSGDWTLEAAETVCSGGADDVLELLGRLVAKSLVQVDDGGHVHYRLLETIRQYALEKLEGSGEAASMHERHLDWFVALAERAEPHLIGADQVVWLDALDAERDNLRAALAWCWSGGQAESGLRLIGALRWYWYVRDDRRNEGPVWLARFLALPAVGVTPSVRVKTLAMSLMFDASLAMFLTFDPSVANEARAEATWEELRALCEETGDRASLVRNHWWIGRTALWRGDLNRAQSLFTEGVAMASEAGDGWALAQELENLGWLAQERGENAEARRYYEESLANFRAFQDWRATVWSLLLLGQTTCRQGDLPAARRSLEEARAVGRRLGQKRYLWNVLRSLGDVARNEGDHPEARALLAESLELARQLADPGKVRGTLLSVAWLAHAAGEAERARALLRDVLIGYQDWDWLPDAEMAICVAGILAIEDGAFVRGARLFGQIVGHQLWPQRLAPDLRRGYESGVLAARGALGDAAFDVAWAEGQAMTLEQAISYCMTDEGRLTNQ